MRLESTYSCDLRSKCCCLGRVGLEQVRETDELAVLPDVTQVGWRWWQHRHQAPLQWLCDAFVPPQVERRVGLPPPPRIVDRSLTGGEPLSRITLHRPHFHLWFYQVQLHLPCCKLRVRKINVVIQIIETLATTQIESQDKLPVLTAQWLQPGCPVLQPVAKFLRKNSPDVIDVQDILPLDKQAVPVRTPLLKTTSRARQGKIVLLKISW